MGGKGASKSKYINSKKQKTNFFSLFYIILSVISNYTTAVLHKCAAFISLVITAASIEKSFKPHDLIYYHILVEICHQRSVFWNVNFVLADKDKNKPT
jgi:hypothetical protein